MAESLSYSNRRTASGLAGAACLRGSGLLRGAAFLTVLTLLVLAGTPSSASAQQDDLDALCASAVSGSGCRVAAAAVRMIHPRVGLGLWGGSPVPGTASTLGMRLGSVPRFSTAGRITILPVALPPLPDRSTNQGTTALAGGVSGSSSVGILSGWSPLPTVGGVLSLDVVGRASWLFLPDDEGFDDGSVLGIAAGLRLGVLRESFTLPGISLTGMYGRSTRFAYGDREGGDDGKVVGSIGNWKGVASVTRRVGPARFTAGATYDRFTSEVDIDYPGAPPDGATVDAVTDRWSAFGNLSWTFLIAHAILEAGWQEAPVPEDLPSEIGVDPTGWWISAALRLSI